MYQKNLTDEIIGDSIKRDQFIKKYEKFILSTASKTAGRYISRGDDEFSVAMIAFNEAIEKYDESKGDFFGFSAIIIRNRIIDEMRKNKNSEIPVSSLSFTNDEGEVFEFDVVGCGDVVSDVAIELDAFKKELKRHEISIFELPRYSPKSKKTKEAVFQVLSFIKNDEKSQQAIIQSSQLLSVHICGCLPRIKPKLLERHRKYIIAAAVAIMGDYPIVAGYINNLEGVKQ